MRKRHLALCALIAWGELCAAGPASANLNLDPVTWYVTVGYNTEDGGQLDLASVAGRAGARFGSYFGVEGEANVGVDSKRFVYFPPCSQICPDIVLLDTARLNNSEALYAVAYLPIIANLDLFGRAGYGFADYSSSPVFHQGFAEQSFNFGVGAQYFVDGANGIRVDYTREEITSKSQLGSETTGNAIRDWSVSFVHRF